MRSFLFVALLFALVAACGAAIQPPSGDWWTAACGPFPVWCDDGSCCREDNLCKPNGKCEYVGPEGDVTQWGTSRQSERGRK